MKNFDEQPIQLKHNTGRVVKQNQSFSFIRIYNFWFGKQGLYVFWWYSYLTSDSLSQTPHIPQIFPVTILQFCMKPRLSFTEILACTALRSLQVTHLHLFTWTRARMRLNFLLFYRILQSSSEKTPIVCGPVRTPGAVVLEPGVVQSQHRRLIGAREGRSPRRRRVKGLGLFSPSSQLLTVWCVIKEPASRSEPFGEE